MSMPIEQISREYYGVTTMSPVGLSVAVFCGLAVLLVPRRWAIVSVLVVACFVSPAQRIVVLGADFELLRLMVLFGAARILMCNEWREFRWQWLDRTLILWVIVGTITYVVLHGTADALRLRLGTAYDAVGMYFLCRILIREWEDLRTVAQGIAGMSVLIAMAFLWEYLTARNLFAVFGGVREITWVREGRMRCQGPFAHPILAGLFWAAVFPLVGALAWTPRYGATCAVVGGLACLFIVYASGSATPVVALGFVCVGAMAFAVRHWMRCIVVAGACVLVLLHFVMHAPVWHLLARVRVVGGETGWHRFYLIDQAIQRLDEWWMFGTVSTSHWGTGLHDITNQYILEGVRGGFVSMVLFMVMLWLAFAAVGKVWRAAPGRAEVIMAWALGVSLFVHATSFIAVSYFGQITMLFYLSLAMPASLLAHTRQNAYAGIDSHHQFQHARSHAGVSAVGLRPDAQRSV